ncbi:MAG: hypothetical protein ACF8GE_02665 [Phycisphaerales bacterium JB043]
MLSMHPTVLAQTVIEVDDDRELTVDDILAGEFFGQLFSLGPATSFEIYDGGILASIAEPDAIDFLGSSIHIGSNGTLFSSSSERSTISNALIHLHTSGTVGSHLRLVDGSILNVLGGHVNRNLSIYDGSHVNLFDGEISGPVDVYSGAELTMRGGTIWSSSSNSRLVVHDGGVFRLEGGVVSNSFQVHDGGMAYISGGDGASVDIQGGAGLEFSGGYVNSITLGDASEALISGGTMRHSFTALGGSVAHVHGGAFGFQFRALDTSDVTLHGGYFELNGNSVLEIDGGIGENDLFTGVLSDGSVIIVSGQNHNTSIAPGAVTLSQDVPTPWDTTPIMLDEGVGQSVGLRPGETMYLSGSATLDPSYRVLGAELHMDGGFVGHNLLLARSTLSIQGGLIERDLSAFDGSEVHIAGGEVRGDARAYSGSTFTITGGHVGPGLRIERDSTLTMSGGHVQSLLAQDGSTSQISGGHIGARSRAYPGSTVHLSGGVIDDDFIIHPGASVYMSGGVIGDDLNTYDGKLVMSGGSLGRNAELGYRTIFKGIDFAADGVALSSMTEIPHDWRLITGILEDGSPLILNRYASDRLYAPIENFQHTSAPTVDTTPIHVLDGYGPSTGLRPGQTLVLSQQGKLREHFGMIGATLIMQGGSIGENLEGVDTLVTISDGAIGDYLTLSGSSHLNVLGGSIGIFGTAQNVTMTGGGIGLGFTLGQGGVMTMSGGTIADRFRMNEGVLTIHGGVIEGRAEFGDGSIVHMSGGTFKDGSRFEDQGVLNMSGGEFAGGVGFVDGGVLNLTGGRLHRLGMRYGGRVLMSGGDIGDSSNFGWQSQISMLGGSLGDEFTLGSDSFMLQSGGSVGRAFSVDETSTLILRGNEFRLDGEVVYSLEGGMPEGSIFTGTLEDGTVFIYNTEVGDSLPGGTVLLEHVDLPETGTRSSGADFSGARGARPGATVEVRNNERFGDNYASVDATVRVTAGEIGNRLELLNSTLTISGGGSVGDELNAYGGSTLNIYGGEIGDDLTLYDSHAEMVRGTVGDGVTLNRSTLNQIGGRIEGLLYLGEGGEYTLTSDGWLRRGVLTAGSMLHQDDGTIADGLWAQQGSRSTIVGGSFGNQLHTDAGSEVTLRGGEFEINKQAMEDSSRTFRNGDIMTGTLEDGTVFILAYDTYDRIARESLVLDQVALEAPDTDEIWLTDGNGPKGLREGQSLRLRPGARIQDEFASVSSTIRNDLGDIGDGFEAAYSNITMHGGSIGDQMALHGDTQLTLRGGTIGHGASIRSGSDAVIVNGSIGDLFEVHGRSTLEMIGGTIGNKMYLYSAGWALLWGGSVGDDLEADRSSRVELRGGALGKNATFTNLSELVMHSGSVGDDLYMSYEASLTITGGTVGNGFSASRDVIIDMAGGTIGDGMSVFARSELNLSGGSIGDSFALQRSSELNLFVHSYSIDGILQELDYGETVTLAMREREMLSGYLLDGSYFDFSLDGYGDDESIDFFHRDSTVTVSRPIPTPASWVMIFAGLGIGLSRRGLFQPRGR